MALIENLTSGSIPSGSNLLVEFDPASHWYNASITIAAAWLRTGGKVEYDAFTQPADDVRAQLKRLGIEPEKHEREEKLTITDWYSATLGQKSKEKYSHPTLKMSELSINWSQEMRDEPEPDLLDIGDQESTFARFNDEKVWVEVTLTRIIPVYKIRKSINFITVVKGIHSEWVYKKLEAAVDGIIEFKLDETGEEIRSLMRIRALRNVHFDSRWHGLKIGENFEVTLEK